MWSNSKQSYYSVLFIAHTVRQLSSGRSTPVIIPEPDLIAIDDELSTVVTESSRPLSPAIDMVVQHHKLCGAIRNKATTQFYLLPTLLVKIQQL
ncbi:hypothetical protein WUBG_19190 [Wuchereria bancrofti]|uniref:Uncharacterized protein n=1 Tax=Wuchereria bancrofti TaxID=6293 RepID=J9DJW1_WUCBA|nr:hypothetical protein WUBG_19190 [Wuchereria bancrofti]